ncbi:outer membrane protein assembly factor BamD [Pontibacter sp. SGAir0037]|nr:outer membrane protein assembly factor BamD [Pontibacter sp. SGAir0037]
MGLLLIFTSCSNYQKLLKSNDVDKKYQAALSYYEKEDYTRANELLKQVAPLMTGRVEAERANFVYAHTYFMQGDYILATYHFKNFYDTYQRSELAEQAMFLHAKSQYYQSPSHEQDQQSTLAALEALQEFNVRYPGSQYGEEANQLIDELFRKLDRKAFESARLYYSLRYYKAAVVAFTNFQRDYPTSPYSDEAGYLKVDAQYRYAKESIASKQAERYREAIEFYEVFVDRYPESKFLRSAEQVYGNVLEELERITSNSNTATTQSN